MKAMLSQPMNGKTEEEIVATREKQLRYWKRRGTNWSILILMTSGVRKKIWRQKELYRFLSVFWQSRWKKCLYAMRFIFAKAGSRRVVVELSMR